MRSLVTVALACLSLPTAAPAEAQLAGRWTLELGEWQMPPGRMLRMPPSGPTTLEITLQGDAAEATLTGQAGSESLRGTVQGAETLLRGARAARVNINGVESEVSIAIELELRLEGEELAGVQRMGREGEEPAWRTVRGSRSSGGGEGTAALPNEPAGGAPGINAVVEGDLAGGYDLIVLANLDPPAAESVAESVRRFLGVEG